MRRLVSMAGLIAVAAACHSSSEGFATAPADAGPAPSASAAPSGSGRLGILPPGAAHPGAGSQCNPAKDAAVCSPDGTTQMSCSLGMWQAVFLCDGPAGCKGSGDKLVCDLKPVKEGDPCVSGYNPPRCNDVQVLMSCVNKKWVKTACKAPGKCLPATTDSPAGCR